MTCGTCCFLSAWGGGHLFFHRVSAPTHGTLLLWTTKYSISSLSCKIRKCESSCVCGRPRVFLMCETLKPTAVSEHSGSIWHFPYSHLHFGSCRSSRHQQVGPQPCSWFGPRLGCTSDAEHCWGRCLAGINLINPNLVRDGEPNHGNHGNQIHVVEWIDQLFSLPQGFFF